ncbi:MAG: hypothetical protein IE909_18045 [Campylobacterales bacterium]|nr:hypothetical protein [Campylobacterales bacterium]
MEFVFGILAGFGILVVYFAIAQIVSSNFSKAKGFNKLLWFFILIATFSWLFGSSTASGSGGNYYGGEDDDDWNFGGSDDSSCSWDSDSSSWDCDDD